MKHIGSKGYVNTLVMPLVVIGIVAIAAIIFGVWAFNGRQNYKNNAQQLINAAVQAEKNKEISLLTQKFKVENENPFTSYTGPQQYGSVYIGYPKNWSGYVDNTGTDGNPIDVYFSPGVVPAVGGQNSIYPLRMEINANSYSTQLAAYTNVQQSDNLTITPYKLKNVNVVGVMITGQILQNIQGVLVMFPLRTNTLELWTESPQYINLFENQILPTVTFHP